MTALNPPRDRNQSRRMQAGDRERQVVKRADDDHLSRQMESLPLVCLLVLHRLPEGDDAL